MPRRKLIATSETFNVWITFTDLMSNAFLVLTLLLVLVISSANIKNRPFTIPTNKPAIITISGEKYQFDSGSAVLPANLKKDIFRENARNGEPGEILKDILNKIKQLDSANKKVGVIEVIGHTDGEEIGNLNCNQQQGSNLDKLLEAVANGQENIRILCPGSNADLGLMRALAVIKELEKAQDRINDSRFNEIKKFRPYSAAQLLLPNGKFPKPPQGKREPDKKRRRIEIRFAQLD